MGFDTEDGVENQSEADAGVLALPGIHDEVVAALQQGGLTSAAAVEAAVRHYHSPNDLPRLRSLCEHHPSALSRLLLIAADHADGPKHENTNPFFMLKDSP